MTTRTSRCCRRRARGYPGIRHQRLRRPAAAAYLFVSDPGRRPRRGAWLGQLVPAITSTARWPEKGRRGRSSRRVAVNVCFTADGLRALRSADDVLCTFPPEFREGIAHAGAVADSRRHRGERSVALGVRRPGADPLHALLIVHAAQPTGARGGLRGQRDADGRRARRCRELPDSRSAATGPTATTSRSGSTTASRSRRSTASNGHGVPTGEFILGYLNHYGLIRRRRSCRGRSIRPGVLPPLDNPYHVAPSSARSRPSSARLSSIASCSRTSPDSGGSCATRPRGAARATIAARMVWLAANASADGRAARR